MSDYDPNYIPKKHYALVGQKVVIQKGNKMLILKRSDKAGGGGLWSLPGGALETGENPKESILREVNEETKIEVKHLAPFAIKSYIHDDDYIVIIGYKAKTMSEKVVINWEHTDFMWVEKEIALEKKLTPDARFFVEKYE